MTPSLPPPPRLPQLRILADDLTGALDCAAAFGAGVPVHLGHPQTGDAKGIDIVATATRDVPVTELPALLSPALDWLRGADIAFKKVDSLLRGNTFDEIDWLARHTPFARLAVVPAFPAQHRFTQDGQQWWRQDDGTRMPVAASIRESLCARGWRVDCGPTPPPLEPAQALAWVPDVLGDDALDRVATAALACAARGTRPSPWLWCGSAGLAQALARPLPLPASTSTPTVPVGAVMLVSASHHPVSRAQWQVLRTTHGEHCHTGEDPLTLQGPAATDPTLIDLCASTPLTAAQAAALLQAQAQALATHAPRPRVLVVVGGDTLLAMCQALGATGLRSAKALARPGWGCAQMVGGRWDGLLCHTRSGAFGGPQDLREVLASV